MAALENEKKNQFKLTSQSLTAHGEKLDGITARAEGSQAGAALTEPFQWEKISRIIQSNLGG